MTGRRDDGMTMAGHPVIPSIFSRDEPRRAASSLSMSPDRLARLVDDHAAALTLYARQWCAAPEDVVQEAFIKLAAQRTPPDQPAAWLYRVVRNGALTAARAAKRRRRYEGAVATNAAGWFVP